MRKSILFMLSVGLFFSCNQSEQKNSERERIVQTHENNGNATKTERQIIVEELKRLQGIFASRDKEKITDIFPFPISNESLGIYIENSNFNEQLAKHNNLVTRNMFRDAYRDISESVQIDEINHLFQNINVETLLQKDTIEYEEKIKTKPCNPFYGIKIENKRVTLTLGYNSNKDYKTKPSSDNYVPENDSSVCEYILWWIFIFNGKQLKFQEISGAG